MVNLKRDKNEQHFPDYLEGLAGQVCEATAVVV